LALAALLFAVVAAFVIGTPARSLRGEPAATTFLVAWKHKLEGSYVVDATFARKISGSDASALIEPLRIAQRPPLRLVVGLGNVSGRTADAVILCPGEPSGTARCFAAPSAPPYDQEVADELATMQTYVSGPSPLYRVTDFLDGCWRLDLAIALPSPLYGQHALFCFDAATGAPKLTVVERPEATEETRTAAIRSTVSDDDLKPPADRGALVAEHGVPTTTTPTTTPVAN
jgi:hypothetical protein